MKKVDLKNKSEKDLQTLLKEKRDALYKFRFGTSGSRTTNVREGRGLKREIARILTILNNKKVA